ncbi:MAG TPA: hypothetical protein PKB09_00055 [Candidatus Saccharibacteria bacterium]|nr:hypothetical protein [Candidatus Saccharibacteria bacterium]
MNPISPQNKDNGQAMDVMSGRSLSSQPAPPTPQNSVMGPADDISQATNDPQMNPSTNKKPTAFGGKKVIILIVIIAVLLGALLVGLLYLQSKSDNKSSGQKPEDNSQSINPTQEGKVSTSEIDSAITSIDKTLNTLDDSTDFTPNDLSDSTLGLSN